MRRLIFTLCTNCVLITSIVQGQLAFYGDVFVSSNNQLHIAFQNTYFNGGKIKTAGEGASEGVVSFSSQSRWQKLKKNSFVEGSVKIYHKGVFSFPIGSEDTFSPITLELLENSGFIQTKFTKSVPHSFAQLNNTFETPFYHYWSWQSKGEVTARIKAYWFEQHRLDRLSFARINPTELYVALYLNSKWEAVLGHHAPNPFTLQKPLSILYGSVSLLEAVKMSDFKGLSFTVQKNYSPFEEKLVSQIITPNNDNINDVWKIKGYEFSSKSTIKMYGINGDLIFEHKVIYNNDWNGDLLNGEKIPEGSYFYHIDLDGNQVVDLQGWILIKY